jgi:hypothetical protein
LLLKLAVTKIILCHNPLLYIVGAIAAFAFTKFLESSAGEAAKKLTPVILEKEDKPLNQSLRRDWQH